MRLRVGQGFDLHPLVAGRPLWLGGESIRSRRGLGGHSDGDVVLHAACNALLGALGEGDLGQHYPPGDPRFARAASERFVRGVMARVRARGYEVLNLDLTIVAEQPRLAAYLPAMRERLARLLGVARPAVSVKAASPEGLGSLGRAEGIAALAVVLLDKARPRRRAPGGARAGSKGRAVRRRA